MGRSQVSHSVPPLPQPRRVRWAFPFAVTWALFGISAAAEDRVIQIANGAALAGQSVQIPLTLSNLVDFAGGDFVLSFDPTVVLIQDVDRAETTDDFLIAHGTPGTGLFSISMAAAEGLIGPGPGVLALLTVQAKMEALEGTITPIVLREARWYDESSVRHDFLGDNGLFRVGGAPPEERPLALSLSSATAGPGQETNIAFSVSMPAAIGGMKGDLVYDPDLLEVVTFQPASALLSWEIDLIPLNGQIHFELAGPTELAGADPLQLGDWVVAVSASAAPDASAELSLANLRTENLGGFAFASVGENGHVSIIGDFATPTSTTTPTETETPSPTPSPTHSEPLPTVSPTPFVPADFDCSGEVDEKDLIRFLEIWKQEAANR